MPAIKPTPSSPADGKSLDLLITIMKNRSPEQVLTWSEQVARVAVRLNHSFRSSSISDVFAF